MNNRAISYVRFSSAPQGKGDSVRRQVEKARAYCLANGLELDESEEFTFTDRGRSGYTGANLSEEGELRRFLNMVEDGRVEPGTTLVVESLDRLTRQKMLHAVPILFDLINKGIRVVTLTGGGQAFDQDATTPALMMAVLEMIRAHEESALKEDRVWKAKQAKLSRAREHGEALGAASHPLWLRYVRDGDRGRYEVIGERADVVRRIFDLAISGRGQGTIANMLTAEGKAPFRGKPGDPWSTGSVARILKNPSVYGVFQPSTAQTLMDGKVVKIDRQLLDPLPEFFPVVVPEDVFDEAQEAISGRKSSKATRQTENFNVWSKVSKCLICGGPMNIVRKGPPPKGGDYLRCFRATRGKCTARRHVRLEQTEEVFRKMLIRLDSMSLIHDNSAQIERSLRVTEGKLQGKRELCDRYAADYQKTQEEKRPSPRIYSMLRAAEAAVGDLQEEAAMLRRQLAAEREARWDDFMEDLDLTTYENRARANRLVQRLGVQAFIYGTDYVITQGDRVQFGMVYKDGAAGYLVHGFRVRRREGELHVEAQKALQDMSGFIPATREGLTAYLQAEDASEEWDAMQPNDGQPVNDGVIPASRESLRQFVDDVDGTRAEDNADPSGRVIRELPED